MKPVFDPKGAPWAEGPALAPGRHQPDPAHVEDLCVTGMTRLRSLARGGVADAGMGELGRMLAYKARWYGCELVTADRWYPSSKTCSGCGHVKDRLGLAERTYRCAQCGLVVDRDVNVAVNLARWPDRHAPPPLPAAA